MCIKKIYNEKWNKKKRWDLKWKRVVMKIRITCIQCSITLKTTIATIAAMTTMAIVTTDTNVIIIIEIRIVIMWSNAGRSPRL